MINLNNPLFITKLPHRFECGMVNFLEAGGGGQFGGDPGPSGGIGDPTGFGRGGGTDVGGFGDPGVVGTRAWHTAREERHARERREREGLVDLGIAGPQSNIAAHEAEKGRWKRDIAKYLAGAAAVAITGYPAAGPIASKLMGMGIDKFTANNIASDVASGSITAEEGARIASGSISRGGGERDYIADPFSAFGVKPSGLGGVALGTGTPLERSTQAGISAQESRREQIREMYEPFYQSAITGGLPQLQAMAEGGEIDYTPSRLYEYSKERGERNIRRIQAAKGQLGSSATEERLSDFRLGLAQEEMDRLYAGQLSRVQLGTGAAGAVGAASRALGGNVAGLYTGLGSGLNIAEQQYGQARQSAYQGLSSSLMGFAKYMEAA